MHDILNVVSKYVYKRELSGGRILTQPKMRIRNFYSSMPIGEIFHFISLWSNAKLKYNQRGDWLEDQKRGNELRMGYLTKIFNGVNTVFPLFCPLLPTRF